MLRETSRNYEGCDVCDEARHARHVMCLATDGERCRVGVVRDRNHFLEKTKPVNLLNCCNEMIVPALWASDPICIMLMRWRGIAVI